MTLDYGHASNQVKEDRLILHDLKGVNLKVDFFLCTREELLQDTKCVSYSICWDTVDVRVEQITFVEQLYELDFYHDARQLTIDDQVISGDLYDFSCAFDSTGSLIASCKILLGRDY